MPDGKLIIFTAPSGAGKTTLVRHLLKTYPEQLSFSISACTREQRYGEINGRDYYFITVKEFKKKIEQGEFLEWQEVYENQFYGTLKSEVERIWALGKHVLFDIDVKGAMNIKKAYPKEAMTVFVKPPSPEVLFERLRSRKTEDEDSLNKRIARAREELTFESRCDKVIMNDNLDQALADAESTLLRFIQQ